MLLAGRLEVDWGHLLDRRHEVTREEIEAALLDGPYEFHEDIPDRFVTICAVEGTPLRLVILFEVRRGVEGPYVWVPNAFWTPRGRRRSHHGHS